jgi:hypothetical protein
MRCIPPTRDALHLLKRSLILLPCLLLPAALFGQDSTAPGQPPASRAIGASSRETIPADQRLSRLEEDQLSPEEIATAMAEALRVQADDTVKWDPRWGDFVELARKKGKLSDDLWGEYLLGALRFKIRIGTWAHRSTGLSIWINHQYARTGSAANPGRAVGRREEDLSGCPMEPREEPWRNWMNLSSNTGSGSGWTEDLTQERYAALELGPQTYHYRYVIQVFDSQPGPDDGGKVLGQRIVEGSIPWPLVAEDAAPPLPLLQADPALRPDVESSLSVRDRAQSGASAGRYGLRRILARGRRDLAARPCGLGKRPIWFLDLRCGSPGKNHPGRCGLYSEWACGREPGE